MPYDGNGNYIRVHNWALDAANGVDINAPEMDAEDNGFAAGLTNCVTRDGQGKMTVDFLPATPSNLNLGTVAAPWASVNGIPVAQFLNGAYFARTPAEIAAGVTPPALGYLPGDVRRFGPVLDGVADDTAALTNWAAVGGTLTWPVPQTALVTATIPIPSNTSINFCEGGGITTATHDISILAATAKTNVRIYGGTFTQTSGGAGASIGLVKFNSCTASSVQFGEFIGAQWAGVLLDSCTDCDALYNYFHGAATGTPGDQNDIAIYHNSVNCRAAFNRCYTTNFYGVLIQDPGGLGNYTPYKNKAHHNWVRNKTGYGLTVYVGALTTADSYNEISNNDIQDITGSANAGTTGCGVYVVGFGAGGTRVVNNTIRNCCTATLTRANAPGHIGVAGLAASGAPVVIEGNIIDMSATFDGILAVSNLGTRVIIANNAIRCPTGDATGDPIRAENSLNTSIIGNTVQRATDQGRCIMLYANSAGVVSGLVVSDNSSSGGKSNQFDMVTAGGGSFSGVTVNGNSWSGGGAGAVPMNLNGTDSMSVNDNICAGTNTFAIFLSSCTKTRLTGNVLSTSGAVGFGTSGICTGSYFDKSNLPGGFIQNTATGLICEQLLSAAPASASSAGAVGDRVEQSVPVVGNPKGWRCTVAGNPGTWVSEGNL